MSKIKSTELVPYCDVWGYQHSREMQPPNRDDFLCSLLTAELLITALKIIPVANVKKRYFFVNMVVFVLLLQILRPGKKHCIF